MKCEKFSDFFESLNEAQRKYFRNYVDKQREQAVEYYIKSLKENEPKKNCGFQYYDGREIVCNEVELTLDEAKTLFNSHYDDMVEKASDQNNSIEVAIWVNMEDVHDYKETLVHLSNPIVVNGTLCELNGCLKFNNL